MKKCRSCKEEKALEEFSKTSDRCRACWRIYMRGKLKRIRLELAGDLPEKTCWRCHRTLLIESFAWKERRNDGRLQECRDCHDPDGPKQCPRCGEIKPRSEFHRKRNGRSSYCKPCNTEYGREQNWRRYYALAPEEYKAMADRQGGCCAICGKAVEVLWVDHDHSCCPGATETCGKCRRGLLCMTCNGGLGMFLDDIDTLQRAIEYLKFHRTALAEAHGVLFKVA